MPEPAMEGRGTVAEALSVADTVRGVDGVDPFNEQTRLDLASGRRSPRVVYAGSRAVAAAAIGAGELDLVVLPSERGAGRGSALLVELLPELEADVSAWSHGDHPAARALAAANGFRAVRTLLHLRLPSLEGVTAGPTGDVRVSAFDHDTDAADWLAVNARAFASHPEQGGMSADDLAEREAEPWFDRDDFLIARGPEGTMLGFHWMKLEPGVDDGEVYVLGVDPSAAGRGVGGVLLTAGLSRMRGRGKVSASLYVEGDNEPALRLYRRFGFVDDTVDVQFRRTETAQSTAGLS